MRQKATTVLMLTPYRWQLGLLAIIALIATLLLVPTTQAQETTKNSKGAGRSRSYFMLGGNLIDIVDLNSSLESKGYSELSDSSFSLGFGGHRIIHRVIIGAEGHKLLGESVTTHENREASLSASYGLLNLGYLAYSTGNFNVYPLLGFGGGRIRLKIVDRNAPSFEEILDNPKGFANLSTRGFLLNIALGGDYLLKAKKAKRKKGGLVFGIRVGYTFAPIKGDWELDDIDISSEPEVSITGPYICLIVGGGGRPQ